MTVNNLDLSFKNHIQTLRAISVLLVFFYHLKIEHFNKGYLGVDIFFVISGFVITQSIYKNFLINKKVNIIYFFTKRIKRIIPNLIFILSVVFILYMVIGPSEISVWNDFISSILGVSNFYFLYSDKGYFYNIFDNPFAHTWSLGVEEQFYLIFPFIFFFIFGIFKKDHKTFIYFISLLIITSFLLSLYFFSINPDISFYFSPLRFWELGFGSLFFFINNENKKNSIVSYISLILIFLIVLFFPEKNLILNNLLIIVLSGIFIISQDISKIFENKYFLYLGKISYSFYLWHLPVIFFINVYFIESTLTGILSFVISVILSSFSYKFIEQYFINAKFNSSLKILSKFFSISVVIVFSFLIYLKYFNNDLRYKVRNFFYDVNILEKNHNWSQRVSFQNIFIGKNEIHEFCAKNSKDNSLNINQLKIKCLKEKNTNYLLFVEGDSHTAQFVNPLNNIEEIYNIYFTSSSNYQISDKIVIDLLKTYKRIFYVTDVNNFEKLNKIQNSKIFLSKKIEFILFNSTPFLHYIEKPSYCLSRQSNCAIEKKIDIDKRDLGSLHNKLLELDKSNVNVHIFDSYNSLCPLDKCKIYDKSKDILFYMDKTHLTSEGAMTLKGALRSFVNEKINLNNKN